MTCNASSPGACAFASVEARARRTRKPVAPTSVAERAAQFLRHSKRSRRVCLCGIERICFARKKMLGNG